MSAMNSSDNRLSTALRELAAEAPSAPPELAARLNAAFARHRAFRRRKQVAFSALVAACLALASFWMFAARNSAGQMQVTQGPPAPPPFALLRSAEPQAAALVGRARPSAGHHPHPAAPAEAPVSIPSGDFIALASFDPAIPLGQAQIVRVELPALTLRSAGYPVNPGLIGRHVLTDVILGQDGRPYAARLVQTRMVH
jgi:hypothetical protein